MKSDPLRWLWPHRAIAWLIATVIAFFVALWRTTS